MSARIVVLCATSKENSRLVARLQWCRRQYEIVVVRTGAVRGLCGPHLRATALAAAALATAALALASSALAPALAARTSELKHTRTERTELLLHPACERSQVKSSQVKRANVLMRTAGHDLYNLHWCLTAIPEPEICTRTDKSAFRFVIEHQTFCRRREDNE